MRTPMTPAESQALAKMAHAAQDYLDAWNQWQKIKIESKQDKRAGFQEDVSP